MFGRSTARDFSALVLLLLLVAAGDLVNFLYKQRHGGLYGVQAVHRWYAFGDGGGRYHYRYGGPGEVPCVHTLLPHQGLPACWWVSVRGSHWT
jgi:hypothetical protein